MPTRENYHFFFLCESCNKQIKRRKDRIGLKPICHACGNKERAVHNESSSRLYRIWVGMKRRCDNPVCKKYKHYGGRGITYCKSWASYIPFRDWAKNNGYNNSLTIERIDVNGNYCTENCTWIPLEQQSKNRRNTLG